MVLMEQRVRELEKDNAELEELLDLLPAVKDWERKLERKASALRHELKRVQARPLVPAARSSCQSVFRLRLVRSRHRPVPLWPMAR